MTKVNYQFVEKESTLENQEESLLELLTSGQKIINEARRYKESVISAAEAQASVIIKQAHDLAREREEKVLKEIEEKRVLKEKQIQDLKQQMLEIQAQIENLFSNRHDILKTTNEELSS